MTKTLSKLITNWCCTNAQSDTYDITMYGIQIILDTLIKLIGLALIAFFTGTITEFLAVVFVFSTLRYFAGGLHMKSSIGCFLSMVFIWALTVISIRAASYFSLTFSPLILGGLLLLLFALVFLYSPVPSRNNPVTDTNILQKKKIYSLVLTYIFSIIIWFAPGNIKVLFLVPLICEIVTILPIVNYKSA